MSPGGAPLREIAALFLRLGLTGFGGPAAHIAMMHEEVVTRRRWIDEARFLDLVGATNLVPGPASTELAIHLGWERGRWRGLLLAGICFIVPPAAIVLALAWAYMRYGDTVALGGALDGIKPVVIVIVGLAVARLARLALRRPLLAVVGIGALGGYLAGGNELALLAAAGAVAGCRGIAERWRQGNAPGSLLGLVGGTLTLATSGGGVTLWRLLGVFLRLGAVVYGSGYVLLAFLQGELVGRLGWLTEAQLLDAVSVGLATPGPVFTTATFIGYLVAGLPGALVATVGIFLPSFCFVVLLTRIVARMRASRFFGAVLDGVNAGAVALMAGVTLDLAGDALVDPLSAGLAMSAGLVLWRTRLNPSWLVGGGALIGVAAGLAG